jgi:hypothetical protein
MTTPPVYSYDGSWDRYRVFQGQSNREPLPASLAWLHPAAGTDAVPAAYRPGEDARLAW